MIKMVFCVDGLNFNPSTLDFPAYLARLMHTKLIGAFITHTDEITTGNVRVLADIPSASLSHIYAAGEKRKIIEQNILLFQEECSRRGVLGKVHPDRGMPVDEIIRESRYADILLLNVNAFLMPGGRLNRRILTRSECPVIIIPENFKPVEEILCAYDGSASSVFAIKQFIYLFPHFADKKITAVYAKKKEEQMTDKVMLMEWLNMHYPNAYYQESDYRLIDMVRDKYYKDQRILTVMGAFGRNVISRMLHESRGDDLMRGLSIPLFISHT